MATGPQTAVRVDWDELRPVVERTFGRVHVRFRPEEPWPPGADERALLEAVDRARELANEIAPEESVEVYEVSPTPLGPDLKLDRGNEGEVRAWLGDVAADLREAGWSGVLELAPQADPPPWSVAGQRPRLTAYLGYTLDRPFPDPRGPEWQVSWAVHTRATEAVCRHAARWTQSVAGAEVHLVQGRSEVLLADHDPVPALMAGLDWAAGAGLAAFSPDSPVARWTLFHAWGGGVYAVEDETADWQERLQPLLTLLQDPPAPLDLAFVRPTPGRPQGWFSLNRVRPALPYVNEPDVRLNRPLWRQRTPDAHGVQVLTDAHLARAHDLSGWDVRPLGGGRHLVQARDLEPWYAGEEPAPDVLEAARRDFGAMIFGRDA